MFLFFFPIFVQNSQILETKLVFFFVVRGFTLPTPLVVRPLKKHFFYECLPYAKPKKHSLHSLQCKCVINLAWNGISTKKKNLKKLLLLNLPKFGIRPPPSLKAKFWIRLWKRVGKNYMISRFNAHEYPPSLLPNHPFWLRFSCGAIS